MHDPAARHQLSVIVVTMNSAHFIEACLRSVGKQSLRFPHEVIVVDNASSDGTVEIVQKTFPRTRLIRLSENKGFSAGNNAGIRASTGDTVLLLNPDTVLGENALEALMSRLDADTSAAAAGPKIFNEDGTLQRTGISFPSIWNTVCEILLLDKAFPHSKVFGRHRRLYEDPDRSIPVDYLQGSCLMVKRASLEAAGLLDEGYFMYFEEVDLCRKFRTLGWKTVYEPAADIIHFGGSGAGFYDRVRLTHFYASYMRYLRLHEKKSTRNLFRNLLTIRAMTRIGAFFVGALLIPEKRDEYWERCGAYVKALRIVLIG
jgi:hypothetical protein